MHCRLLIPGLFPPEPAFATALGERRYPCIETLVARARRSAGAWHSLPQWLLEAFSVARQHDWPSAPFALLGDGGAPGEHYWMHAEPVHLLAQGEQVLLADPALLDVRAEELQAIAQSVNAHFGAELHLEPGRHNRWYARLSSPPAQPTLPLRAVLGRPIERASASLGWHALMNEMQMLLHGHPVNEARESLGAPALNGIWLWGGGRLAQAKAPPIRTLLSDHPLALGLAGAAGVRALQAADGPVCWLEGTQPEGIHLAVLTALCAPVRRGEPARWAGELESLERRWLAPLCGALKSGRIGMVSMHLACDTQVLNMETTRSDLRRFWRRRRPLARYRADR